VRIVGGVRPVVLATGAGGEYEPFFGDAPLWRGGERLEVSAAGDAVPAFDATVRVPATAEVVAPRLPASGATLAIARAAPLTVRWVGGAGGAIVVELRARTAPGSAVADNVAVRCVAAADGGELVLPPWVVGALPAGRGQLVVWSQMETEVAAGAGAAAIVARARSLATQDGGLINVGVSLE